MGSVGELRGAFVPVAVMGGVTAVYSVARLRHRWHFARAFFTIALANLGRHPGLGPGAQRAPAMACARHAAGATVNAFAVGRAGVSACCRSSNTLFGLTSDITLLELSDLNRPLLKRLQLEAPGTYHHSMVVGSLAEAAAEAIGANSLLARVSAYYHDIGKLSKPEYYAENEPPPRAAATRSSRRRMSTLVVKSHITEGLEMAKKRTPAARGARRHPRAPRHHGDGVLLSQGARARPGSARREDFCYPGPRPRSKETAILMLADGVEGASRALAEPTPSRIRGLVTRIIDERVQQGQLDECGLTLQELARIREAFMPVLTAIFHVRAPYPEDPKKRARADADFRRETT